jgi:hypothetical protein
MQLLAEANISGLTVAGEARAVGGLADRVAQRLGRDRDAGRHGRSAAPSRRTIAWKYTSPRAWNSATSHADALA